MLDSTIGARDDGTALDGRDLGELGAEFRLVRRDVCLSHWEEQGASSDDHRVELNRY
jgi:hypothetical protein